jgi:uncharacterized protein
MTAARHAHFAVPVFDRWLLHFPLHGTTALVEKPVLDELRKGGGPSGNDWALEGLMADLTAPPSHQPGIKAGGFDPAYLALITTRTCNISCVYCDFGGPTSRSKHMEPAVAEAAIRWMAGHLAATGRDLFTLHFFGGEPLVAGALVEFAVDTLRSVCKSYNLDSYVDISTNGVMSDQRLEWLATHLDSVILSFDGPPEFQNRNRPGRNGRPTFEAVDRTARRLMSANIELCLRSCITRDSVLRMPEMTRWMIETYRPAIINFEPLTENDLTDMDGIAAADPYDYARMWMASRRIAERSGVRLVYSATETAEPRLSSCPVGSDTMIVTPDGSINGCYLQPKDWLLRGMDMSLGSVLPGGDLRIQGGQVQHLREVILDKPRCRNCFCQWSCSGGCHVSNTYRNCPENYIDYCQQTRVIAACLLLEDLGEHALVDELLADEVALRRLALHPTDVLPPFPDDRKTAFLPPVHATTTV